MPTAYCISSPLFIGNNVVDCRNNINICCLQETEVPMNFPEKILNCGGYTLELENNSEKKRAGIYLKNDIKYKRRIDLEKQYFHIVIGDVVVNVKIRIINIYQPWWLSSLGCQLSFSIVEGINRWTVVWIPLEEKLYLL